MRKAASGVAGNGASLHPLLDAGGTVIVFESDATDLVEGGDRFRYDFATGYIERFEVRE